MPEGVLEGIFIAEVAKGPMIPLEQVLALEGLGLDGDRYAKGEGDFNKGEPGRRQVTLMNAGHFMETEYAFGDSRRNLFVRGCELMRLIGQVFRIGEVWFYGVKYCDPCDLPKRLEGKTTSFKEAFHDKGGLIAMVLTTGNIKVGDQVFTPYKNY